MTIRDRRRAGALHGHTLTYALRLAGPLLGALTLMTGCDGAGAAERAKDGPTATAQGEFGSCAWWDPSSPCYVPGPEPGGCSAEYSRCDGTDGTTVSWIAEPAIEDTGGGFTLEPDPLADKRQAYLDAARKAGCLLRDPACNMLVSTIEWPASDTLENQRQLDKIKWDAPARFDESDGIYFAYTWGPGLGTEATIELYPRYYTTATPIGQVLFLIHEIGHATGRINGGHGPYFPNDPKTSDAWDDRIKEVCMTAANLERCK